MEIFLLPFPTNVLFPFLNVPDDFPVSKGRSRCFNLVEFLFPASETFIFCWWNFCFLIEKLLLSQHETVVFTRENNCFD